MAELMAVEVGLILFGPTPISLTVETGLSRLRQTQLTINGFS